MANTPRVVLRRMTGGDQPELLALPHGGEPLDGSPELRRLHIEIFNGAEQILDDTVDDLAHAWISFRRGLRRLQGVEQLIEFLLIHPRGEAFARKRFYGKLRGTFQGLGAGRESQSQPLVQHVAETASGSSRFLANKIE